jgi:predicted nucleic acid-binding protein
VNGLLVDTSVWSLALRRDAADPGSEVAVLKDALERSEPVYLTGLILQELLQGFSGPRARVQIIDKLAALPLLVPDRGDHINAAELRNQCRRAGVQIGTIDALLAQLCLRHELLLVTTDADFAHMARITPLRIWQPTAGRH